MSRWEFQSLMNLVMLTNRADSAKDTALFGAEKETKEDVEFALDKKTIRRNKL